MAITLTFKPKKLLEQRKEIRQRHPKILHNVVNFVPCFSYTVSNRYRLWTRIHNTQERKETNIFGVKRY